MILSNSNPPTILVTGATGLLGRFIVLELQRRGIQVRALVRQGSEDQARALGVEIALGKLEARKSLLQAASGVSGIIHAACTFTNPEEDIKAMQTLLEAWDQGPFVFITSVDVYGYPQILPIDETHPLESHSDYGRGKLECERLLEQAARKAKRSDWSILRPPHIWGPDRRSLKHRFSPVSELFARIEKGQPIALPGEKVASFGDDWVDARELAWAVAECLNKPLGGAANAINSHFLWGDFCQTVINLVKSSSTLEYRDLKNIGEQELPSKNFFAQTWQYAGKKLEQHLGFRPKYLWQNTLAESLTKNTKDQSCR